MIADLETWLTGITGYDAVSLQPNAGSQGEYAGLLAIQAYHAERGQPDRDVCLIPSSAHGTNAASAALAGMRVVVVACRGGSEGAGDVDLDDLRAKVIEHADRLSTLMITYPSTHGVYEHDIADICAAVHDVGGQVYVDEPTSTRSSASPGRAGSAATSATSICTRRSAFRTAAAAPASGPSQCARTWRQYLPGHPLADELARGAHRVGGALRVGVDSADHLGLYPDDGRRWAAGGVADRDRIGQLHRPPPRRVLPGALHRRERHGRPRVHPGSADHHQGDRRHRRRCGKTPGGLRFPRADHEFPGGRHAHGRADRKREPGRGRRVLRGDDRDPRRDQRGRRGHLAGDDNPLRGAPHTAECLLVSDWDHPYTREQAAYPLGKNYRPKVWPPVRRIDGAYGDRNLVCSCPPVEAFA